MAVTDGLINSRNLCSQAVVERVLQDASVSSVKIANNIQSDNFVTGVSGWRIERNTGSAEFQDAVIRGTLNADDIVAGTLDASVVTVTNINASNINTGTLDASVVTVTNLNASNITTGTMAVTFLTGGTYSNTDITFSAGSDLISSNYSATPGSEAGWKIEGDGDAFLNDITARGTVYATAGEIGNLDIEDTLTMNTDGAIFTSSSTTRVEIRHAASTQGAASGDPAIAWLNSGNGVGIISNTSGQFTIASLGTADLSLQSADDIFFVPVANHRMTMNQTALFSTTTYGGYVRHLAGSESDPTFTFVSDDDTGMRRSATNQLAFPTGGTDRLVIDSSGVFPADDVTVDLGTSSRAWDQFYAELATGSATTDVNINTTTHQLYRVTSTIRNKKNVRRDTGPGLDLIRQLRPAEFEWKTVSDNMPAGTDVGLIAEDVYAVDPRFAPVDKDGIPYSVAYTKLISPAIRAIQENDKRLTRLEAAVGL